MKDFHAKTAAEKKATKKAEAAAARKLKKRKTDAGPSATTGLHRPAQMPPPAFLDRVGRAEDAEHAESTQIFRPNWSLWEDESVTQNSQSAENFFDSCVPLADRFYATQMGDDTLNGQIATSVCKVITLSWHMRRRYTEQKKRLLTAEADLAKAARSSSKSAKEREISELKAALDRLTAENTELKSSNERLKEENAVLKSMADEAKRMAASELKETYSMGCDDFLEAIRREYPDLELSHLIPDPGVAPEEAGGAEKGARDEGEDENIV